MLKETVMTPVERLRAFIADMLQWDVSLDKQRRTYDRNFRDEENPSLRNQLIEENKQKEEEAKERLRSIFNEHLSARALVTIALARLDTMMTSRIDFMQEILEDTESRRGKTIYIETFNNKTTLAPRRRYAIAIENDAPKIDAVYAWRNSKGKWNKRESI
jgi:hypothetical protein